MACGYLSSLTCDRTYTPCSRSMGPPGKQLDLQGSPSLYFILAFWLRSSGGSDRKRLSTMWETWVQSLGREVPWRRKRQPTPVLLPRKSHGRRSLVSMGSQRVGHDWATSLFFFIVDLQCYVSFRCMIYNVGLVSVVENSGSVIHIHIFILFQIIFPYR